MGGVGSWGGRGASRGVSWRERGCWRNLLWENCRIPPPPGQPSGSHGPCSSGSVAPECVCGGIAWAGTPPPPPLSYALRSSFSEQPPRAGQLASWAAVGQAGVSSLCPAHLRPYYPGPNPTGVKKAGAVETCVSVAAAADGGGLPGPGTTGALLSSWGPRAGRAPGLCIPPAGPTAPRHLLLGGVGALLGSQGSREGV